MGPWSWATLGVRSLDTALSYWVAQFGFEKLAEAEGPDPGLEQYWGLAAGSIARQALVASPGCPNGRLHLVQYVRPGDSVRAGAEVFDLCPKNLDIYVDDLPRRMNELRAAGLTFRTQTFSEVTAPSGVRFREVHLAGHDDVNLVLLQLLDTPLAFGSAGYRGIGPLIVIVADPRSERAFYRKVIGLQKLHDNVLAGPEIERMIGLPAGASLDVSIWGIPGEHLGQVEIIAYRGTRGQDLYPRARPGVRGLTQVSWRVDDLAPLRERLGRQGIDYSEHALSARLLGKATTLCCQSPAGFRIELHQPD